MKKMLLTLAAATMLVAGAHAQSRSAEAKPLTDTRPQLAAEAKKKARQAGVVRIKDGSSAEGAGSGLRKTSQPQRVAEERADAREAQPHSVPVQGGTPK